MDMDRRTFLAGTLASLASCRRARSAPLRVGGVTITTLEHAGTTVDLVRLELGRARLALHWRRPDGKPFGSLRALHDHLVARGERPLAITNAGIFGDEGPIGLHVERGVELHRLNLRDGGGNFYLKPNGVFSIGAGGAAVVDATRYRGDGVQVATQSGPLLVAGGVLHPRFAPRSLHALVRSGIGVRTPDEVWLACTRGAITFYDFAVLYRDRLGCADALYLDGTISRLYAPAARLDGDGDFMGMLAVM
jgi:uncharacterized protein YigE (DUF2233 family)